MFRLPKLVLLAGAALVLAGGGQLLAQAAVAPSQPWAQTNSDLPADPLIRFGTLPNGMRYALRHNSTPRGHVALRLRIDAGSLMEKDNQRGLAHFMEHMAFNGTKNIPENELVSILEREGLAFGADTNATTGFDQTTYMLNLPRNTAHSIDTALNILREQMSEASMTQAAIDGERGVVMGEARVRDTPQQRAEIAQLQLIAPRLAARIPIGDLEVIRTAPRDRFVEFYNSYYRPSRTTLIAVGDFDVDKMEAEIRRHFSDWQPRGQDGGDPVFDRSKLGSGGVKVHVEPGAASSLSLIWTRTADRSPASRAKERRLLLRVLGVGVLNERLGELGRSDALPFKSAQAGQQDIAKVLDVTSVTATYHPGRLDAALAAVEREARRLVRYGISKAELQRQIGVLRRHYQGAVAGAATRPNGAIASEILSTVNDGRVVTSPEFDSEFFEEIVRRLTPAQVMEAVRPLLSGANPLLWVITPTPVPGGEVALTQKLAALRAQPVTPPVREKQLRWTYTDFGKPGTIADRRTIASLGITIVTFANGNTLTIKPTKFSDDEIFVSASTGLGELGMSADRLDPLYGARYYLVAGGLGKLTSDQMVRVLTGHKYGVEANVEEDRFIWRGSTNAADLTLQMQVLAAHIIDPGLRSAPLEQFKTAYTSEMEQAMATPLGVFRFSSPGLLASGDKRAAMPSREEVQSLDMAKIRPFVREAIGRGPINVIMVGDVTVDQAIAATAATFGALAPRGPAPVPAPGADHRRLPSGGETVTLHHTGSADQSFAYVSWPGPDFVDDRTQGRRVQLLSKVMQLRVIEIVREREALAYNPAVVMQGSKVYRGSTGLAIAAQTAPDKIPAFFDAVDRIAADLQARPVTADELSRARTPLIEALPKDRATNEYWAEILKEVLTKQQLVEQAQNSEADYRAVTPADIQAMSRQYLNRRTVWRLAVTPASIEKSRAPARIPARS